MSALSQRASILLVEDEENDVALVKRAFEQAGLEFPVINVPGGLEAMAYLRGDPPYYDRERYPLPILVLLDIKMPRVDGFEVLQWIRQQPAFSKMPVAMLTSSEALHDAKRAYQLGASSFLVKQFDFQSAQDVSRAIKRLIANAQTGDQ